jgi:hypothetical protein
VPALRRFMAPFTSSDADLEYRAMVVSPLGSSKTPIPAREFRKVIQGERTDQMARTIEPSSEKRFVALAHYGETRTGLSASRRAQSGATNPGFAVHT